MNMSHGGPEDPGTGLKDVLDILFKTHKERLLSLTFQLGESPEENIVHALCLIILQKEERALNKLQMLKDNYLATHLAEKWQTSGGKSEDFTVHCGRFQELTGESLAPLARVFKVLSEQRLCDPYLRNVAYGRALSGDNSEDLEYGRLREEANAVCGPEFAAGMCSSKDLRSELYRDPLGTPDEGTTTFKVSLPSPLQASSSMPSYPTHLEISIPTTASFQPDKRSPETCDESRPKNPVLLVGECESGQSHTSQPQSSQPPPSLKHSEMDETSEGSKSYSLITQNETTKPTSRPDFSIPTATSILLPKMAVPNEMHGSAEEEEEEKFYAFVILHAPEDEDVAESMRERVEAVIESEGATFSGDFAIPGRSTLRCVEDAINNSAFTLLLLTRNFNTRMLEVETDSALINSINKTHKYNTVIPLLPRENRMPRMSLPTVLQTINSLEENNSFERKLRRAFTPARIRQQKKIWQAEQTVKRGIERKERLSHLNHCQKKLMKEYASAQLLERESLRLFMAEKLVLGAGGPFEPQGQQQQHNIHIENAQYIMIGNDSQMKVDLGGGADKDDSEE